MGGGTPDLSRPIGALDERPYEAARKERPITLLLRSKDGVNPVGSTDRENLKGGSLEEVSPPDRLLHS